MKLSSHGLNAMPHRAREESAVHSCQQHLDVALCLALAGLVDSRPLMHAMHGEPPHWQPLSKLDERRVARPVVDPSIGRSGQRVGKHRHGPVHLWSRLLSFESGSVLVDPGRDEGVRAE